MTLAKQLRLYLHKSLLCFCLWGLGVLDTVTVYAADPPPFQVGEKLTYHFYWEVFMVGRGTFEVREIQEDGSYVFVVQIKSNDFISNLYPVEDLITSVFDLKRKRAIRFLQDRKEGANRVHEETLFSYKAGQGTTESLITKEKKEFEIPKKGVQDKLSFIYYMRCLDWQDRSEASTTLGNDKGNYEVKITKLKTETLKLDDFEKIQTFKVEPDMEYLAGFVKKGKMSVWVSDDRFKIPVRVVSKLPAGTVSASLVKVEGVDGWPYNPKD